MSMKLCRTIVLAGSLAALASCAAEDPAQIFDLDGRADATPSIAAAERLVVVTWGASDDTGTEVYAATSHDGGRTFEDPVRVSASGPRPRLGGEFPPRVVISGKDGAREVSIIYTARDEQSHVMMARSRDDGRTFGDPVRLQQDGAAGSRGWASVAADEKSAVHAIWLDHRGHAGASAGGSVAGARHEHGANSDGAAMAQRSSLLYRAAGSDGGEREITRGVCYCCKTTLVTAPGGRVHAAWRHVYSGNLRDIAMATSTDGGMTFGAPVRVSEDGWEINGCPDDGPSLALDARGTVHVAWPSVLPGDEPEGALFIASGDGRTFRPRERIPTLGSRKPSHPQLIVTGSGRMVVAWDEMVDGVGRAALREIIRKQDGATAFGPVVRLNEGDEPAMYPVLGDAGSEILAVWSTGGTESLVRLRRLRLP